MTTEDIATEQRKPPFGFKTVALPAADYGLDEDGWIWLRNRITIGFVIDGEMFADESRVAEWLPQLIGGWYLKADGVELPYGVDYISELPIEALELVNREVTIPLAQAATQTDSETPVNGSTPTP
jgi:hypothetical protein